MKFVNINLQLSECFADLWRDYRVYGYHGGRASGKSHAIAEYLVSEGLVRRMRGVCAREIQRSIAASSYQLIVDKIDAWGLRGVAYKINKTDIYGPLGTHFMFPGLRYNPEAIKSYEGLDFAWVEEASNSSERTVRNLIPTVLRNRKSEPGRKKQVIFTFNRNRTTDPIDKYFFDGPRPRKSVVVKTTYMDNPYLDEETKLDIAVMKANNPDMYRHVYLGEPLSRSDAKVFPEGTNWVIDDLDGKLPDDARLHYGADWGFSVDPTVLLGAYVFGSTIYVRYEAGKRCLPIEDTPAFFAGDDTRTPQRWENKHGYRGLPNVARTRIVADSARPETIDYMKRRGFDIHRSRKGQGSVNEGIEFLRSFNIVIHPNCIKTIDEFRFFEYKIDSLTEEVIPELRTDLPDHFIDSLRYIMEAYRRAERKVANYDIDNVVAKPKYY